MTTTSHRRQRAGKARKLAGGALLASAVALGAAGPAAAVQTVTVSPDSNLPDTANVNVSGAGFGADTTLLVYQCADVGSVGHCTTHPIAEEETNGTGAFGAVPVTVQAVFTTDIGPTECRTRCRIEVLTLTSPAGGRDGISFDRFSSK